MKKWRERGLRPTQCLLIDCVSFTVSIVLVALLSLLFSEEIYTAESILQNFVCTSLISILIYFTSRLPIESEILGALITLLDVAAVMLFLGMGIFRWFPWEIRSLLLFIGVFVTVFFVTYAVMLLENKISSDRINQAIREKKNVRAD
ncbi:MAG TPA: DUF3021 family protein [Candidatus Pullichristensenella excrementigallinarum]|uniref:DUF3021 family protein n=1 Tax=Candidatus Pullichristensenella excrementigallinarum TaxID=2840907 RepID=A0A9D1IDL6_9FIRM|nr:DUF3021 family protein [Candidatus Pullichristensenella excrementigallinarum]